MIADGCRLASKMKVSFLVNTDDACSARFIRELIFRGWKI